MNGLETDVADFALRLVRSNSQFHNFIKSSKTCLKLLVMLIVRPIELAEMKYGRDTPQNNFVPALEAIGNLLLPELDKIVSGGWSAALSAHTEIEIRPIKLRTGAFYRHFLPLLKDLISLLTRSYRRDFKLALAHPNQTGRDPHEWVSDQLQPAIVASLEWIREWYILACDGENQYVRHTARVDFAPGQTVSASIPLALAPFPPPESWRAPAWLFQVGPVVGIGPLKTKNVPANDSEERLSAAHTRLLLKGARRVFLGHLSAAIETVRNEEVAAAGAIQTPTVDAQAREPNKRPKHWLKGTEGLVRKADLSKYTHGMTERQQMAFSLKYEYELGPTEIASRMGLDRKTVNEHIEAANKKIKLNRASEIRKVNRAKGAPEE
jgi:DNA-binding CsgD family transcriptional regulator